MFPILIFSAVLAVAYLAWFCTADQSVAKSVVKTGSVLGLACVGALTGSWGVAAALIASAMGDYFISRNGTRAFLAGMGAFALAHLIYMGLFIATPTFSLSNIPIGAIVLVTLIFLFVLVVVTPRTKELRLPVMLYAVIISEMAITAFGLAPAFHIVLLGACLFVLSDLLLSLELFVYAQKNRRPSAMAIWSSYWIAQAMILFGFLGIWPLT